MLQKDEVVDTYKESIAKHPTYVDEAQASHSTITSKEPASKMIPPSCKSAAYSSSSYKESAPKLAPQIKKLSSNKSLPQILQTKNPFQTQTGPAPNCSISPKDLASILRPKSEKLPSNKSDPQLSQIDNPPQSQTGRRSRKLRPVISEPEDNLKGTPFEQKEVRSQEVGDKEENAINIEVLEEDMPEKEEGEGEEEEEEEGEEDGE